MDPIMQPTMAPILSPTWTEPAGSLHLAALKLEAKRRHFSHRPPETLDAWLKQRETLKAQIRQAAGIDDTPCDLAVETYGSFHYDGYEIRKLSYQSRPGLRVTANLYIPAGEGPFPGVLGVHGHWTQGKVAARVAARGHELARAGFVALCVDAFGSGERCTIPGDYEYHGAQLGASLMPIGRTLLGMQIIDNMAGLDLLESLPCVDGERLGVTGASGGGNQTMWLAAMDDRIKAAVPVVSVGTFESYIGSTNCICETLPGGLTFMEEWGALALAAPSAMLILNALGDSNAAFQIEEAIRSADDAARVYDLYGHRDKLSYQVFNTPHGYWPALRGHMLGWFTRWLKDEGEGRPLPVPVYQELPEKDLLCFPDFKRPDHILSLRDWIAQQGQATETPSESAAVMRSTLLSLLRLPQASPVTPQVLANEQGQRWLLETTPGYLVSAQLTGTPAEDLVIAVHTNGIEGLRKEREIASRLAAGQPTLLVELRCTGETAWDKAMVRVNHDWARAVLWLGRTAIGEWIYDLQRVMELAAERYPEATLKVTAYDSTALAAVACAALDPMPVTAHRLLSSYVIQDTPPSQDMAIFIPGIATWGDVPMLAALAGDQLEAHPVDMQNKPLEGEVLAAWTAKVAACRQRLS